MLDLTTLPDYVQPAQRDLLARISTGTTAACDAETVLVLIRDLYECNTGAANLRARILSIIHGGNIRQLRQFAQHLELEAAA